MIKKRKRPRLLRFFDINQLLAKHIIIRLMIVLIWH